jgi:hypothetical protein
MLDRVNYINYINNINMEETFNVPKSSINIDYTCLKDTFFSAVCTSDIGKDNLNVKLTMDELILVNLLSMNMKDSCDKTNINIYQYLMTFMTSLVDQKILPKETKIITKINTNKYYKKKQIITKQYYQNH